MANLTRINLPFDNIVVHIQKTEKALNTGRYNSWGSLEEQIENYYKEELGQSLSPDDLHRLVTDIENRRTGFGILTELVDSDDVTDIAVNRFDEIKIQRVGGMGWEKVDLSFGTSIELRGYIGRLMTKGKRGITTSDPIVDDLRLSYGPNAVTDEANSPKMRVFAAVFPASNNDLLVIRKFRRHVFSLQQMATPEVASMTPSMRFFLKCCVDARLNILVSGGTGSGKTTLLSALLNEVLPNQRMVLIEDPPEIILPFAHQLSPRLEVQRNVPGLEAEDLLIAALRMTPDRIIVGEVRGKEGFTMLQAMNTGHEGSMSTIHANTADDAIAKLETLALRGAVELPYQAIKALIGTALNIVVQLQRAPNGQYRYVAEIAEVTWDRVDKLETRSIFKVLDKINAAGKREKVFKMINKPLIWESHMATFWPENLKTPWVDAPPDKS